MNIQKLLLCMNLGVALQGLDLTECLADSQTRRIVLVEEFTNLGCGPCAAAAPAIDSLLNDRIGDVAAIKYHVSWPYVRDEFYLADKEDINARKDYYDVTGVPAVMIDGKQVMASAYAMNSAIEEGLEKERRLDIGIESSLDADNHLTIDVSLKAMTTLPAGALNLYACLMEEYVKLDKAALNGETECIYSCRKMLPDGSGLSLNGDFSQGWTGEYHWEGVVDNFKNTANLGIVVFVQDASSQEVIDAVYAPRNAGTSDAATIVRVTDTPDKICSPHFSANLKIRNTGSNPLQEAKLNMEVNGELQQTLWTGNLNYLENAVVSLPDFSDFTLNTDGLNVARFWLSDINGMPETESGVQEVSFSSSKIAEYSVQLIFYTDKKPEESNWTLYDENGQVVAQSQPYTEPRHKYVEMLPVYANGCYTIDFSDAGGDGIIGNYGNGYYQLSQINSNGEKKMLYQGDYDNAGVSVQFGLKDAAGSAIDQIESDETLDKQPVKYYDQELHQWIIGSQYRIDGNRK